MVDANVFLKPDPILKSLEAKLNKAKESERAAIQAQIDARQAEITAQYGSVGFGSGGYVIPNYAYSEASGAEYGDLLAKQTATQAAVAGKMQLIPSATMYKDPVTGETTNLNPIYQAQYYGPQGQTGYVRDPETGELVDQYEYGQKVTLAQLAGKPPKGSNKKTFYDETGKELSAEQVAKTAQGVGFASKGWDIGFGPGMIAPGVDARNLSEDQLRGTIVNNLVASGEMRIPGYDPVTGTITPTSNVSGRSGNTGGTVGTGGTNGTGGTGGAGTRGLTQADVDTAVAKAVAAATAKTDALVAEQKAQAAAAAFATKTKASDRLKAMFDAYGLGSLAAFINKRIMEDASEDAVLLELYEQPEYKLRFPGIANLRAKKRTITENEYMNIEKQMTQTARFFDLPTGFYDNPDDFGKLIGNEVSAKEYQDRLQVGQDLARQMSPAARAQLQEFYNVGEGGITAYVLDPERALALIQKQSKAAQFVGFGRLSGFKLEGMTAAQAEQIAGTEAYAKLSAQQMQTALGQAAQLRQTQSRLTGIEGEVYNEGEALKAVIEGSPEAILASQQRAQREGARFGGASGVTGSSLRSSTMI
jgi:hypothetical protein